MRLVFPNGEHSDLLVGQGETSIGSAPDNGIVLTGNGIQEHHGQLSVDARGYTLTVFGPHARMHVNARPIFEKAILRLGDVVSVETVQMVLKPDDDRSIKTSIPASRPVTRSPDGSIPVLKSDTEQTPPKVVLRGVSGSYFGKIVRVRDRVVLGRGSDCDLILDEPEMSRQHAMIENKGDHIYLRDLGSTNGTYVNGVQLRDAVLHPGDQLTFECDRFLLEAPGLPLRTEDYSSPADEQGSNITQTMRAIPVQNAVKQQESEDESKNEIWWLIGTAALIGSGIALLLLVRF